MVFHTKIIMAITVYIFRGLEMAIALNLREIAYFFLAKTYYVLMIWRQLRGV